MDTGTEAAGYRSRFGGCWPDRSDAADRLQERLGAGTLTEEQAARLRFWMERGYVILEGAVSTELVDEVTADVERAWQGELPSVWVEYRSYHVQRLSRARAELRGRAAKMLDLYVDSEAARQAMHAPAICEFLSLVFEEAPLGFQSLTFNRGSEQPVHQDTAYVRVSSPMKLAAAWIALEDITPGSGELVYYEGSHEIEEYVFEGEHKHLPDGYPNHDRYLASLHEKSRARNLELKSFLPKKGDALIWSADLAHGGAPITTDATRKSYVIHYCPVSCDPGYFDREEVEHSEKIEHASGGYYCHTIQGRRELPEG